MTATHIGKGTNNWLLNFCLILSHKGNGSGQNGD